jgi:NAD+ kinase
MKTSGKNFVLSRYLADGLFERDIISSEIFGNHATDSLATDADVVLSFGGDGTLLNTAHELGHSGVPILGVNLGRLGFMTNIEMATLDQAVSMLETGSFEIEERLALQAISPSEPTGGYDWALNEITVQRSGEAGLLTLEVLVNGKLLNTFWADGLVIATPTGSTAYSLALGGPIMSPGCGAMLITPIAPHTLTVRPIVIPDTSVIEITVKDSEKPHLFTADGVIVDLKGDSQTVQIRRADFFVPLVRFPDQEYFATLRNKLMWGLRKR